MVGLLELSSLLSHSYFRTTLLIKHRIRRIYLDLPEDACWIPSNDMESRHIFRHHTSSTDSHAAAQRHAWQHDAVTAEPTILADGDIGPELWAFDAVPEEGIEGMSSGVEGAAGSD